MKGRRDPRVGAAEAEADGEERRAVEPEQQTETRADVLHHLAAFQHVVAGVDVGVVDDFGLDELFRRNRPDAGQQPSATSTRTAHIP